MSDASTPVEAVTAQPPAPVRIAYSPRGRQFFLTDEMIALRDGIARGLGFVLRPCSMGNGRECWESPALDCNYRGVPCSSYHGCRSMRHGGKEEYFWPKDAEAAAYAVDKGKPRKVP